MTSTFNANPSSRPPPPPLSSATIASIGPQTIVQIAFRQSSDGVNFTETPVYLPAIDAARAVREHPAEYSSGDTPFATWPTNYDNSAQPVGGRGRRLSSPVACG